MGSNAPNGEHPQISNIYTDSLSLHSALARNDLKDKDPWLKQIKKKMFELQHSTTLLWVPSHCGIPRNDKADELPKAGSELPQDNVPVTHQIIRMPRSNLADGLSHTQEQLKRTWTKVWKIEKKWPKAVRSLFSRLRTGHAKELKSYRHFIALEDDSICLLEEETIKHVLSKYQKIIPGSAWIVEVNSISTWWLRKTWTVPETRRKKVWETENPARRGCRWGGVVFVLYLLCFKCEINFISKENKQIPVNPDICTRKGEEDNNNNKNKNNTITTKITQ